MPPLPPNINTRSHSLDGLLDSNSKESSDWTLQNASADLTAEGLYSKNSNETKPMTDSLNQSNVDSNRKAKNRRSKSLDDLLDDQMTIVEDDRETQSMENILESAGSKADICSTTTPVSSEKLCENEVMIVDSSMTIQPDEPDDSQNDSGIASDMPVRQSDNSSIDEDTLSNTASLTSSTTSDKKSGKTFLNKYVKKVRNLMKK